MTLRTRTWRACALVALSSLSVATPALAQQDSPSRGITLPDRGLATQDDAASVEVNPAGLGFARTAEFNYNLLTATPDLAGTVDAGHAFFASVGAGGLGAGAGVQFLRRPGLGGDLDDYRKYTLSLGFGDGSSFALGASYNFFGSDESESLDGLGTWDVGAQIRLAPWAGLGLFVRDLDASFLDLPLGRRALDRRVGGALALRFFEGRVVLEPQVDHVLDSSTLSLVPRVAVEPMDGLRIFGRATFPVPLDPSSTATGALESAIAGIEASFGSIGVQTSAILSGEGLTGTAHSIWLAGSKKRSLLSDPMRFVLIDLASPFAELPSGGLFSTPAPSFIDLMFTLDAMARDEAVQGVVLNVANPSMGWAQAWEFRQAIERLEAAGKKTVAVVQSGNTKSIFLASAADTVWMMPNIAYEPEGLSTTIESYQGALAKLGVDAEFVRVRDFKSAPEAYVRSSPSENALLQTNTYLDALFGALVQGLADARSKSTDEVTSMIDSVPVFPHEAVEAGWVDAVIYGDELEAKMKETFGPRTSLSRGWQNTQTSEDTWETGTPEVGILVISGAITQGPSADSPLGGALAGSSTLNASIERLRVNPKVKAVVVRIDSPGGSALASDQIWRELRRLAQVKPVVASMGDIAASGGYYVAAGADEIWASPLTLTGSIGIFAGKFNIKALADRVGVRATVLRRGEVAGSFNTFEPLSDKQRDSLSRFILYLYELFIQQVANTRPFGPEQVDEYARGRVWTGADALERKLVDSSGGIVDATRRAEELAGLEAGSAFVRVYPQVGAGLGINPAVDTAARAITAAATGLVSDAARDATPAELRALSLLLAGVPRHALLPLLYSPGEALMLPYFPIVE